MKYKEIEGDLIELALMGKFDVIAHGCNCFCNMGAGIAPKMAKAFGCDIYSLENKNFKGDINKLGQIEYKIFDVKKNLIYMNNFNTPNALAVVNAYTQYFYGRNHSDVRKNPLDYEALALCLRKINNLFKGKHIGLPMIGCGLAGGIWSFSDLKPEEYTEEIHNTIPRDVKTIIQQELKDCDVTIVIFKK